MFKKNQTGRLYVVFFGHLSKENRDAPVEIPLFIFFVRDNEWIKAILR